MTANPTFPAEPAQWDGTVLEIPPSLEESRQYCEWLAVRHYENFPVATLLLPAPLRRHFYSVYAYCRWADDLADETGDPERSVWMLERWEQELRACYAGKPRHAVFVALREAVTQCRIPPEPFHDLITAFRQDQMRQRYATYRDVLEYCRFSANPVGRLVLYLCGYREQELQRLSDFTCTALQLANFWQDVRRDYVMGRIYIPQDVMKWYGCTEEELAAGRCTESFRELMKDLVDRTKDLFGRGMPLVEKVDRRLAVDIELFSRGGLEILRLIERQNYDVLVKRPKLDRAGMGLLLGTVLLGQMFSRRRHTRVPPES